MGLASPTNFTNISVISGAKPIREIQNMVVAIVPAFNEEKTIGEVMGSLRPFVDKIIVVDDGSRDATAIRAREAGAEVLTHLINRGQGAALETGRLAALRDFALRPGSLQPGSWPAAIQPGSGQADIIVTFDADGQFDAEEIPGLILPIKAGECDVVLGSRFLRQLSAPLEGEARRGLAPADKNSNIPPLRRLLLKCATIFTRLTTGLQISDTHNGFRAFSRAAAERISITQDKMAHASEILSEISRLKLKYLEIPVTVRYTEYSLRKGQKLSDTIKILKDLFWGRLL